jgi:predicted negative regulator of RcsB-dependent stress response
MIWMLIGLLIVAYALFGYALWKGNHANRKTRESLRNAAWLESTRYECELTPEQIEELHRSRWDGD